MESWTHRSLDDIARCSEHLAKFGSDYSNLRGFVDRWQKCDIEFSHGVLDEYKSTKCSPCEIRTLTMIFSVIFPRYDVIFGDSRKAVA